MITLLLTGLCLFLFGTGYYFGNQMGQTRHIRTELAHARSTHTRTTR
jgi:hypothetical protein